MTSIMRIWIMVVFCASILNGCAFGPSMVDAPQIANETKEALNAFAKPGQTTNWDVLRQYGRPPMKRPYEDGGFVYVYNHQENMGYDTFSFIFQNKIIRKTNAKYRNIGFIFSSEGILIESSFIDENELENRLSQANNDYKYSESNKTYNEQIDIEDYIEHITIGTQKEQVLHDIGVPIYTHKELNMEFFSYIGNKNSWMPQTYTLVFKNDKLIKKYNDKEEAKNIKQSTELNDKEKTFLQSLGK